MSVDTKSKTEIKDAVKPFHRIRTFSDERSDGTPYTMGFVEFKEDGAPLSSKEQFVTFEEDVIDELSNAGRGDLIDLQYTAGKDDGDPVITDAMVTE